MTSKRPGLPIILGTAISLISITATLFALDARYLHAAQAQEAFQRATGERELGDLENQRQLILLEIGTLTDDSQATRDRRDYLKARLQIIEARLLAIKQ